MRFAFIILVAITIFSCKKPANSNCQDVECKENIQCVAHWYIFEFKLLDKNTREDIVFGNNPRCNVSDIKLFSDVARIYPINLYIDSADSKIMAISARPQMYLEIKGTDIYQLTAEFRGDGCCSSRIKNLWQDGKLVCSCCDAVIPLLVR